MVGAIDTPLGKGSCGLVTSTFEAELASGRLFLVSLF